MCINFCLLKSHKIVTDYKVLSKRRQSTISTLCKSQVVVDTLHLELQKYIFDSISETYLLLYFILTAMFQMQVFFLIQDYFFFYICCDVKLQISSKTSGFLGMRLPLYSSPQIKLTRIGNVGVWPPSFFSSPYSISVA